MQRTSSRRRASRRIRLSSLALLVAVLGLAAIPWPRPLLAQEAPPSSPSGVAFEPQVPPLSNDYPLTPDSLPQKGVPKGQVFQFTLEHSSVFPSATHAISVYVPAEYRADKPACVFVFLDGLSFHAPAVFDNLIAEHKIPVMVAIGVSPGSVAADGGPGSIRYQRSFEFDDLSDRLARFLLQDVFPAMEAQTLPDGRRILLSKDGNDRAIAGGSTGGIGAFNVAWRRPDAFRRVFSIIGTFVGMRGGETEYIQVRKTEPKPLRVFLQDGAHDGWTGGLEMGDWWMANLTMDRALEFAGYDVRHVWGAGDHNGAQGDQIFPEVVRWLWRDYPTLISAMPPKSQALLPILAPGEDWMVAMAGCRDHGILAADPVGAVYLTVRSANLPSGRTVQVVDGTPCDQTEGGGALAFGADGTRFLWGAEQGGSLEAVQPEGRRVRVARMAAAPEALAVTPQGDVYAAVPSSSAQPGDELWLLSAAGGKRIVASGLHHVGGLAFFPDRHWLMVTERDSVASLSYRVRSDGALDSGEPFFFLVPDAESGSGAASVAFDREGRAFVATSLGIQICDHNGRVMGILALPHGEAAQSLAFGGPNQNTLYVLAGDVIYRRALRVSGFFPAAPALAVPDWNPY